MFRTTGYYGVFLVALGLAGFIASGKTAYTALLPAAAGVVILVLASLSQKEGMRKNAMHAAAGIGLVLTLMGIPAVFQLISLFQGAVLDRPLAAMEKAIMGFGSFFFVLLCIRSFIDARRSRTAGVAN